MLKYQDVLLIQADTEIARPLENYFTNQGARVRWAGSSVEARLLFEKQTPDLVVVDLNLPQEDCLNVLQFIARARRAPAVILSSRHPDLELELRAKAFGVLVFVRAPFTEHWMEQAVEKLTSLERKTGDQNQPAPLSLPRLRTPVRLKITLPYVLLAGLIAALAVFVAARLVFDSLEQRFTNQLVEAGKLTSDWVVLEENRLLEVLRILANTERLPEALQARDVETLRKLALPVIVNTQEEDVHFLDMSGVSVLTLYHPPDAPVEEYASTTGEGFFASQLFIQRVLQGAQDNAGNKFAAVANTPWGAYLYIAGPVTTPGGRQVGVIVIGKSLGTLVFDARQSLLGKDNTFAHITLYDFDGAPLASTLPDAAGLALDTPTSLDVLEKQATESLLRPVRSNSLEYTEILGPLQLRDGADYGLLGTAIAREFVIQSSDITRIQIFTLVAAALVLVVLVGTLIANLITNRLEKVVDAAVRVAEGNLDVRVEPVGADELTLLSHFFNYMVSNIREGVIYRDLLSRAVTPQVREQLRQNISRGELKLEGQTRTATILMTDLRSFTPMAENLPPTTVMAWLNEYFGAIVPIVTRHEGVISEFVGDGLMAYFGVLPEALPAEKSALEACKAAVEILQAIELVNQRRVERGDPALITGIGINTGPVAAGALGASERMHYAIIGDTVNTTARLEDFTREFGVSGVALSEATFTALGSHAAKFHLNYLGEMVFKGRSQAIPVYRLHPTVPIETHPLAGLTLAAAAPAAGTLTSTSSPTEPAAAYLEPEPHPAAVSLETPMEPGAEPVPSRSQPTPEAAEPSPALAPRRRTRRAPPAQPIPGSGETTLQEPETNGPSLAANLELPADNNPPRRTRRTKTQEPAEAPQADEIQPE